MDDMNFSRNSNKEKYFFIVFLCCYIVIFVVRLPKMLQSSIMISPIQIVVIQAITYALLFLGTVSLFRRELLGSIRAWKLAPVKNMLWLLGALVAEQILPSIAAYPAYALGHEEAVTANSAGILLLFQAIGKPLALLVVGLAGPVVEESIFRAFLIGRARAKIPVWVCIIISSLLFALTHMQGFTVVDLLGVLPYFATGTVFGIAYAVTGNISLPLILHIANNMMGLSVL